MLHREGKTRFIIYYSYFSVLLGADDDVMMKVFMIGVVVIFCVVGVAVNPQILGNISLPDVSLTNTYHLTLMSCVAASMVNLGYFLSALSKIMRVRGKNTDLINIHGCIGVEKGVRRQPCKSYIFGFNLLVDEAHGGSYLRKIH